MKGGTGAQSVALPCRCVDKGCHVTVAGIISLIDCSKHHDLSVQDCCLSWKPEAWNPDAGFAVLNSVKYPVSDFAHELMDLRNVRCHPVSA